MEIANIYYTKEVFGFVPKQIDLKKDYALVCKYPIPKRMPNDTDIDVLETLFHLFNWMDEGFQPNDPAIGFNRPNNVYHTSMSVGDIVDLNGTFYACDHFGWTKIEV